METEKIDKILFINEELKYYRGKYQNVTDEDVHKYVSNLIRKEIMDNINDLEKQLQEL